MGAGAFAERARRELRATGETVPSASGCPQDDLTAQESEIARLAGEGRTNTEIAAQLFLSPRTVERHLGKVFTKLGISSRRELPDARPDLARADEARRGRVLSIVVDGPRDPRDSRQGGCER